MNIHSIYENNIHFKKHLKKILRREVLKNDGCKRINELTGLQPAEPRKHPNNHNYV